MNEFIASNRALWNEWTPIHRDSAFYDVESFKRGAIRLHSIEREALGDVAGKTLLHLQCHFGLDTLSWARLGATVTGADFSGAAIDLARSLSVELGIDARFVCSDLYDLPNHLAGEFDIVYTSYGVLGWLPDLRRWGEVIAHFLRPGGTFFVVEAHPFAWTFDDADDATALRIAYPYFQDPDRPVVTPVKGSYANRNAAVSHPVEYNWNHPISEIINALTGAGLRVRELREFPFVTWQMFPFMEQDANGYWRLRGQPHDIPLLFSLRATK